MAIVSDNLIFHLHAGGATGTGPGTNSPSVTSWKNLVSGAANLALSAEFDYTATDGWAGAGSAGDPYHLHTTLQGSTYSQSYASVASHASFHPATTFTYEVWVKMADTPAAGDQMRYFDCHLGNAGVDFYTGAEATDGNWRWGTGAGYAYTGTAVLVGQGWSHRVLTYNGTVGQAYTNGATDGGTTTAAYSAGTGLLALLTVGENSTPGYYKSGAQLAAMRIYSDVLTGAEVSQNYAEGPQGGFAVTFTGLTVTKLLTG
jgi:hypothetical protein